MIAALLLALTAGQAGPVPTPPADWSALPPLPYARRADPPPALGGFVRGEIAAGRCALPRATTFLRGKLDGASAAGWYRATLDVALAE